MQQVKNSKCEKTKKKTLILIVAKHKNSKCDKTQDSKCEETQIVTKIKNSKCDTAQKL